MIVKQIKKSLKAGFPDLSQKYLVFKTMDRMRKNGQLAHDGWFRSVQEGFCVDASGSPIPWITYPAIDFLKKRLKADFSVFEYGCGASTLWWAKLVRKVVSCEHDKNWYGLMKSKVPANVELLQVDLQPGGKYCRQAREQGGKFDIVVVDGRDRVNCAIHSLDALTEDGIILWDNSDRERYAPGFAQLAAKGFRKIEFTGMTPLQVEKSETGIFYRDRNCLGI